MKYPSTTENAIIRGFTECVKELGITQVSINSCRYVESARRYWLHQSKVECVTAYKSFPLALVAPD